MTFLSYKYFRNHLEDCILNGKPLLIQDVGEELDPVLNDILEKNLIKSGTTWKVEDLLIRKTSQTKQIFIVQIYSKQS